MLFSPQLVHTVLACKGYADRLKQIRIFILFIYFYMVLMVLFIKRSPSE